MKGTSPKRDAMSEPTTKHDPETETGENPPSMRGDLLGILAILAASAITYGIAAGM